MAESNLTTECAKQDIENLINYIRQLIKIGDMLEEPYDDHIHQLIEQGDSTRSLISDREKHWLAKLEAAKRMAKAYRVRLKSQVETNWALRYAVMLDNTAEEGYNNFILLLHSADEIVQRQQAILALEAILSDLSKLSARLREYVETLRKLSSLMTKGIFEEEIQHIDETVEQMDALRKRCEKKREVGILDFNAVIEQYRKKSKKNSDSDGIDNECPQITPEGLQKAVKLSTGMLCGYDGRYDIFDDQEINDLTSQVSYLVEQHSYIERNLILYEEAYHRIIEQS